MAEDYQKRLAAEKAEQDRKEVERLQAEMAKGGENAINAALNIIRKNRPELLK